MKRKTSATNGTLTRTTDAKARVTLPKSFASLTVIVEQVTDTEVRVRKARVIPEEVRFLEEEKIVLSNRDRDIFLALLDHPPKANQALRRLANKKRRHG